MIKLRFFTTAILALALSIAGIAQVKAATTPSPLANAVILIIRHAEKPDTGSGLTPTGQQRADTYVKYFENFTLTAGPQVPDYLIATADSANSERPRLTITPLSKALNLKIDSRFKTKQVDDLVQALQSQPTGKTILICWHHEKIADLLTAFGADPNALLPNGKWPDSVYGWVIVLRFDANGNIVPGLCQRISEHLMPDDSE